MLIMENVQIHLAIAFPYPCTEGKTDGHTMVFVCVNHWNGLWATHTKKQINKEMLDLAFSKINATKFSVSYPISHTIQD